MGCSECGWWIREPEHCGSCLQTWGYVTVGLMGCLSSGANLNDSSWLALMKNIPSSRKSMLHTAWRDVCILMDRPEILSVSLCSFMPPNPIFNNFTNYSHHTHHEDAGAWFMPASLPCVRAAFWMCLSVSTWSSHILPPAWKTRFLPSPSRTLWATVYSKQLLLVCGSFDWFWELFLKREARWLIKETEVHCFHTIF